MKVQAHSSLEPPLESPLLKSGPATFDESGLVMTFENILGVTEICSFRLVLKGKKLEFLETFLVNNFALSDAEGNTSGSLNRGGIVDLPL